MITDVCLCEYTRHGHCGVVREDGEVDNDSTLELLAKTALSHAEAGADVVAPVGHDGRPRRRDPRGARRGRATPRRRSSPTRAKYASAFYGPVPRGGRVDAPSSATGAATRWTRPTPREALREVVLDVEEGADIVMVKPALPVPRRDRARARGGPSCPSPPTNVSGEYAMLKAAARNGWLDERARDARDADRRSAAPAPT